MKTAAGPQKLWEALNAKYRLPEGGKSFDEVYEHAVWHNEAYNKDHYYLILTRKDGEEPKPGEVDLILKSAKKESPDVEELE
jgi:hypothetical protein